jgi:DNA-binding NarL/FixJ family response regulator
LETEEKYMTDKPSRPIRVLLADDHHVLREGVRALATDERDMEFVAEASSGQEAIEEFRKHRPDVALMDLQLPDISGIEAMIAIRTEFPEARIIILTTYSGDVQISRALKAGARAYLLKSLLRRELLDTIRAVHAGQKRIPAEVAAQLADHLADDSLTYPEIDVLRLIAAGNANKIVAERVARQRCFAPAVSFSILLINDGATELPTGPQWDDFRNCVTLATLGAALAMLGPGVRSIDARLIGLSGEDSRA